MNLPHGDFFGCLECEKFTSKGQDSVEACSFHGLPFTPGARHGASHRAAVNRALFGHAAAPCSSRCFL